MSETDRPVIDWSEKVRDRVRDASHTILCCWDEWEHSAGFDATVAQESEAYFEAMYAQLDTVLLGVLDDNAAELLAACETAEANISGCLEGDDAPSFVIRDELRAAIAKAKGTT